MVLCRHYANVDGAPMLGRCHRADDDAVVFILNILTAFC